MSDIQLQIATYDLQEQTLRYEEEFVRGRFSTLMSDTPERSWRPMFPNLLEKYMTEHGWTCWAESSSGNRKNMGITTDDEGSFKNQDICLRPEKKEYLPGLEGAVLNLAEHEERSPEEIMRSIFTPLERAKQALEKAMEAEDETKYACIDDRLAAVKPFEEAKRKQALKDWRTAYDQKSEDYKTQDIAPIHKALSDMASGKGGPFKVITE